MPRRNHSRRAHAPYGSYPGIGYAGEYGDQSEYEGDEGRWAADRMDRARRMVSERPHASVLAAFGVGFGLGLVVTLLLSRAEGTWFERYAPEAIQDLPDRLRHAKDRIASAASAVPGSIQQAGESLASYVPSSWRRW